MEESKGKVEPTSSMLIHLGLLAEVPEIKLVRDLDEGLKDQESSKKSSRTMRLMIMISCLNEPSRPQ